MFKRNIGGVDRALRIIVGLVLLALVFVLEPGGYWYWGLIGLVPLLTALIGNCPAYSIIGLSTCPMKKS